MAIDPIKVTGLAEFRRSLRAMDTAMGPAMRKALNAASTVITDKTPPWVPRKTGRAAASIRARSTQTKAQVVEGGARAPYMPWLDFGGRRPDGGTRPFRKNGRFIFVTLGKHREEIADDLQEQLVALAEGAGLEVT